MIYFTEFAFIMVFTIFNWFFLMINDVFFFFVYIGTLFRVEGVLGLREFLSENAF